MDDRFDFQLLSASMLDGKGLSLLPGTYRAFGNDGLHFDTDINSGNNLYYPRDVNRSNALADALHAASDHLPVVADYQMPVRGACPADVNDDGTVDVQDLAAVVLAWGPCRAPCPYDITADETVDVQDLVEVMLSWGECW